MRNFFVRTPLYLFFVFLLSAFPPIAGAQVNPEDFSETPPDTTHPDYDDPEADEDDDGVINRLDRCPLEWASKAPGCPDCNDLLLKYNIDPDDLYDYLHREYNFGYVAACGNNKVYRCERPDQKLASILRQCYGITSAICMSGGLTSGEKIFDNRCRHLSKTVCRIADIRFYNECRPNVVGPIDIDSIIDLIMEIYAWDGNTVIHCFHGRDRTGLISSIIRGIELCSWLDEPLRSTCLLANRLFYFDLNLVYGGNQYPDLDKAYDECVSELVPGTDPLPFIQIPIPNFPNPVPAPDPAPDPDRNMGTSAPTLTPTPETAPAPPPSR